jgi:MFS family permease
MTTAPTTLERPVEPAGLAFVFRALRGRNFRLFFAGQSVSLIGTWMQRIAMSWLVYRLSHSPFLLGVAGFAGQIPTFLLAPFAGALADRWDRRRTLLVTQTLAMLQAVVLAVLVMTGAVQVWHVIALAVVLGAVNGFDMPVRQSFIVQMIDRREDLGNAIALNSSMVNGARLLGPSAAGILIAAFGEGVCFLLNAASYIAVIAALAVMRIPRGAARPRGGRIVDSVREGFWYVFGSFPIRAVIMLLALVSLVGMPYQILMPVFAKDVLGGGPHTFGFLMGASGLGALVGTIYLASRRSVRGLAVVIGASTALFGAGLVAFSFSRVVWFSVALMFATGLGMIVQMASSNTLLQTVVEDDKRGRVMSFYTMAFMGMAPFGSLLAGSLAAGIGAPATLLAGGAVTVVAAAVFGGRLRAVEEMLHPTHRRTGIASDEETA